MSYPYCKCDVCLRHYFSMDLLDACRLAEVALKNRDQSEMEVQVLAAIRVAVAKATDPNFMPAHT